MALSEIKLTISVDSSCKEFRFRSNWRSKLILQRLREWSDDGQDYQEWRDASVTDLRDFFIIKESKPC